MARARKDWPRLPLVQHRGAMTADDVIQYASGPDRDAAIEQWAKLVWEAWREQHATVAELVDALI
jgi:hypothetical protein